MDKKIKVVPLVDIEYEGQKRKVGCEPFEMEEQTAKELIAQCIVKKVVAETTKKPQTTATKTEE